VPLPAPGSMTRTRGPQLATTSFTRARMIDVSARVT
jgi:hypothetical protein